MLNFKSLLGPQYYSGGQDFNNLEYSQYIQALVLILAFLVQWYFRRRFLKICTLFSLFRIYLPFKKSCALYLTIYNPLTIRMLCTKFG